MAGHRIQHGPRHQGGAGVVEVEDVRAPGGLAADTVEVDHDGIMFGKELRTPPSNPGYASTGRRPSVRSKEGCVMPANRMLIGPGGRLFAEPQPGRTEAAFRVDNTSQAYFNSPYFKLHQKQVQPIPAPSKNAPLSVDLAGFVGPDVMKAIAGAGMSKGRAPKAPRPPRKRHRK